MHTGRGIAKSVLRALGLYPLAMRARDRIRAPRDNDQNLVYVHIGKCGGETLWNAIESSPVITARFRRVSRIHIRKPPLLKRAQYLIVVRNPIDRALSAFNWRYTLVVETKGQEHRFPGEYDVLTEYRTLNRLAEALYDAEGQLDNRAAEAFRSIHHLKEDIAFYLDPLLPGLAPEQLFAVMVTETLDQDMERVLQVPVPPRKHSHRDKTASEKLMISETAWGNLRRFLEKDYDLIEQLMDMAQIYGDRRDTLMA